ncbi:MAG: 2-oxo acid dehydrogenase subunit E2 [Deltaproteobacteria bacterium]|nr:2-oxo acid dehydrogenase subunit E2 [Deltaproteobacteria bacterium]
MGDFRMPSLGADMDAATLVAWKKRLGEEVARGEIIAVVETEKGAIDVECWEHGTLDAIRVEVGAKVPVGTVLAHVHVPGEATAPSAHEGPEAKAPPPAPAPASPVARPVAGPRLRVSPAARKLAAELGVPLEQVRGTGIGGAIQREDVASYASAAASPTATADRTAAMRHAIGAAVSRSKREIPHYYLASEVDLTRCFDWLTRENAARTLAERVLPAAVLLAAVARAAVEVPGFNGHWVDGAFRPQSTVALGVAVSLRPSGLVVVAVRDAEKLSVVQLYQALEQAAGRARSGALRSSDLELATLTVSQLGDRGADMVQGVIFPPQVALVGIGRIRQHGSAAGATERRTAWFTLAADHRVTDGHAGSRFLATIDRLLQAPEAL